MSPSVRAAAPWLTVALVVWGLGLALQRRRGPERDLERPSWQQPFLTLSPADQRTFRQLRESLYELERLRVASGAWPSPAQLQGANLEPFRADERTAPRTWTMHTEGLATTYLGVPDADAGASRFLVLFLEPPQVARTEPAPPEDEEHHTLRDGTPIHVTVWTQPHNAALLSGAPSSFPAAEGWVQRLSR